VTKILSIFFHLNLESNWALEKSTHQVDLQICKFKMAFYRSRENGLQKFLNQPFDNIRYLLSLKLLEPIFSGLIKGYNITLRYSTDTFIFLLNLSTKLSTKKMENIAYDVRPHSLIVISLK